MFRMANIFTKKSYLVMEVNISKKGSPKQACYSRLNLVQDYVAIHSEYPFKSKQELLYYLNREEVRKTIKNFIIRKLGF